MRPGPSIFATSKWNGFTGYIISCDRNDLIASNLKIAGLFQVTQQGKLDKELHALQKQSDKITSERDTGEWLCANPE